MTAIQGLMRVRYTSTGAEGTVTDQATYFLTSPGPWYHVQFDDGLRCWVLASSVQPPIPLS